MRTPGAAREGDGQRRAFGTAGAGGLGQRWAMGTAAGVETERGTRAGNERTCAILTCGIAGCGGATIQQSIDHGR
ncbi:unnamed protein product [Lampetra planeri]